MEVERYEHGVPSWVDLGTPDIPKAIEFYSGLFGWQIEQGPPEAGGYSMALLRGRPVAGLGPQMNPGPPYWTTYVTVNSADDAVAKATANGGKVLMEPMDVMDAGRMAIFADPIGAVISAWQPGRMADVFPSGAPNTFAWAELNARGIEKAIPFYAATFGWTAKKSEMGEGAPPYTEFQLGGESIAGGTEMNPMVPAQVPSYWIVYFGVDDVDGAFKKARKEGAEEMLAPMDFPGGRFGIVRDPQGAAFGLLKMKPR